MKWILFSSLILNVFLGLQLLRPEETVREEIVERIVVKKSAPEVIEKKVIVKVPGETVEKPIPAPVEFDEVEMEDSLEAVNKKREDFLVGKLGFTERDFQKIEGIKRDYIEKYQKLHDPGGGPLSITQRKLMLQLEEQRDVDYARAVGVRKWKEWESFRDQYNRKLWKRSMKNQSGLIVPMEI